MGVGVTRNSALDGLRAISVLAVIGWHARAPLLLGGASGVDVFFVLSGFLITSILASGPTDLGAFLKRRAIRLTPALAVMVATVLALSPWLLPQYADGLWRDALLAATYSMNVAQAVLPHDNPYLHTWSLAAEVQFYLLWPLVLPWLIRRQPGLRLLALWIGLIGVQFAIDRLTPLESYYFPHLTGLALGAAIAFFPPANRWLGVLGLTAVVAHFVNPAVPRLVCELGAALAISALRQPCALANVLSWRPLASLGLISYGVYLWHFPFHCLLETTPWFVRGSAALLGGIACAAISYSCLEKPLARRLRPALAAAA